MECLSDFLGTEAGPLGSPSSKGPQGNSPAALSFCPVSELKLPADGKTAASLKPGELKMAAQLISDMTGKWQPADYAENFSAAVHKLVNRKIKAGQTESVTPVEDGSKEERSSNVIDLTELLARSLKRKTNTARKAPPSAKPKAAPRTRKPAAKPALRKRA